MIANIISKYSFSFCDVFTVSDYDIVVNSEYDGKSQLTVHRKPMAEEEDFLILHGDDIIYQGIIDNIETSGDGASHIITVIEMPRLFDQKVILTNESLLQTGIEDFIVNQITENFISNADEMVNIDYLTVTANTHTPVAAKVSTEEGGIYNLCTYIGNALTNYGVFITFEFTSENLHVVLEKREQSGFNIDTEVAEIQNVNEIFEVKALAKLTVVWKQEIQAGYVEDDASSEPETEIIETVRQFFLRTDRTITEDVNDPDRAKGMTDVIAVQTETEAAMIQEARNQFAGNAYQHKISFDLANTANLIEEKDLYIGHKCKVKTKNGIKDSFLSGITRSSAGSSTGISLGNMKVGLIEKLKGVEQRK